MIDWLESHTALSGWAQAFGAIVALTVAIAIPTSERGARRRVVRRVTYNATEESFVWLSQLLEDIAEPYLTDELRADVRSRAGVCVDALRTIPLYELPPSAASKAHDYITDASIAIMLVDTARVGAHVFTPLEAAQLELKLLKAYHGLEKVLLPSQARKQPKEDTANRQRIVQNLEAKVVKLKAPLAASQGAVETPQEPK